MAIYNVDTAEPQTLETSTQEALGNEKPTVNPLVEYVNGRFSDYEKQRQPLETKWDAYYRTWRCLPDEEDKTQDRPRERSQIKIPAVKEAVTNATDSIYQILFPPNWFDIQPMPTDLYGLDPMQAAQLLADKVHKSHVLKLYCNYLFEREMLVNKLYRFIQDAGLYGTAILRTKVTSRKNKQVQRISKPPVTIIDPATNQVLDQMPAEETVRSVEQEINHPETDFIPLETFYTNINATGTQAEDGCEGMVIRSYQKNFFVQSKFGVGVKEIEGSGPAGSDEIKAERMATQGLAYQPASNDVEVMEYWGFVPNDVLQAAGLPTNPTSLGEEMVIITANQEILLKFEQNPFPTKERPFIRFCFEEVNNEFYGLGIAEVSDGPQRALNAMFRSRLDNMALSLNNIFGINFDKMVAGQDLSMSPGKGFLFHGDPREALFPIVIPDVTANIYRDTATMQQVIQSAHGVSPMLGGRSAKGGEQTATEVSMLMAQSTSKIKTIVGRFERTVIVPLLKWYVRLMLQYLNEAEIFAITDPATGGVTFKEITPDDVAQDYEFVPRGVFKMQAANEGQKYAQALQLSANPLDANNVNRRYLWQKFYESMGLDDLQAAILTTPPQPQPMLPSQPGQPGLPTNPTVTGQTVQPGPVTNSADQPGGMLSLPNQPGGMPRG